MTTEDLIILYEDNHIIVVLKPQNVPSCEDETGDADMLTLLKKYIKEKYNKPGNVFVGLVHRLDRPTGGVMVYAKTSKAAARLSEQMKSGDFEKKYMAVVSGEMRAQKEILVNYLKKNPVNNTVYICTQATEGAKRAELEYKVLESKGGYSLLDVELRTGRSHQIRVQLAAAGNPIYGDRKYGKEEVKRGNLALFAYSLKFTHPVTKERMVFMAEPPKTAVPWKAFKVDKAVTLSVK